LAGAAALAGLAFTLVRSSGARAGRSTRAATSSPRQREARPTPAESVAASAPASWQDAERISSSPDALDLALDLEGLFDGKLASEIEITARPNEHVPAPHSGDDEDAPSPDDLGRAWLLQATESERSLSTADTLPELENLRQSQVSNDLGENADDGLGIGDDDETTAEYVRKHRISSAG